MICFVKSKLRYSVDVIRATYVYLIIALFGNDGQRL